MWPLTSVEVCLFPPQQQFWFSITSSSQLFFHTPFLHLKLFLVTHEQRLLILTIERGRFIHFWDSFYLYITDFYFSDDPLKLNISFSSIVSCRLMISYHLLYINTLSETYLFGIVPPNGAEELALIYVKGLSRKLGFSMISAFLWWMAIRANYYLKSLNALLFSVQRKQVCLTSTVIAAVVV